MKFSIITVCYNSEQTIERTIQSVLSQTYNDIEYIVVDGASHDNTLDIVKKYEPIFNGRMKWISEPDKGIFDAMNKGIRMATGDIIGIVNSDDWLEDDAISRVWEAYVNNNQDSNTLYCGAICYHYLNGNKKKWDVNLSTFRRQARLFVMAGIRHPAVFVPKDVYCKIGLFNDEMKLSADQDFILRCYYGGISFVDVKAVLSNMSEGGISTDETDRSHKISESDRKIMLAGFGKRGLSYYWLFYSWKVRGYIRRIIG